MSMLDAKVTLVVEVGLILRLEMLLIKPARKWKHCVLLSI